MVTSFQSVAGGWHFSQGLLSPEVATQGIANLPPAPLPGAALGEMAHPPRPWGTQEERQGSASANTCLPLADGMNVVHEAGSVCSELLHTLCASPCFHTLASVLYFTNTIIPLKGQFLKTDTSLPAHTCICLSQGRREGNV